MSKLKLTNVRLSFPSLFKRAQFENKDTKFEGTFLLDKEKDAQQIAAIEAAIESVIKDSGIKIPAGKRCLADGDDKDYDGYAGCMSLKTSANKRPTVIDRDKSPLVEDDDVIYAGCYVNAIVDFWVQNNQYGKRVNGNLYGVQFVKDGEPFGSGPVDVTDDFDELDEI
jgi:hypothetical protein